MTSPDSRRSFSIRSRRFSSALVYLSLWPGHASVLGAEHDIVWASSHRPSGRIPLLLDVGVDTFSCVVVAVRTRWCLSVAFDLLLPAHIASLDHRWHVSSAFAVHRFDRDYLPWGSSAASSPACLGLDIAASG